MVAASFNHESFLGGEWSPFVQGRHTSLRYPTALARCYNFFPRLQGSLVRRPGTILMGGSMVLGDSLVIISAEFPDRPELDITTSLNGDKLHSFIIGFRDTHIRFFKNDDIVTEPSKNVGSITNANPAVVTVGSHGYSTGDRIILRGFSGDATMMGLGDREYPITVTGANTFTIPVDTTNTTNWGTTAGFGVTSHKIYEITSPYTAAQAEDIQYTQSDKAVFLFHKSFAPYRLQFNGDASWVLSVATFTDGPYFDQNITTTTLTLSGITGSVTVTASAVTGINNNTGFQTTDVGRWIRFTDGTGTIAGLLITARSSTTVVTATITVNGGLTSGAARTTWRLGLWSDTTGWPACGAFHEGRLWASGSSGAPKVIAGSRTEGQFEYFSFGPSSLVDGTVSDADSVVIVAQSNAVSTTTWLASTKDGLLAGTLGGPFRIWGGDEGYPITPTSVNARPICAKSCAAIRPIEGTRNVLFVHGLRRKLYELTAIAAQTPDVTDVTFTGEHLTESGLKKIAFQDEPHSIVWAIRSDGVFVGCNYLRTSDDFQAGWHQHAIASGFLDGQSAAILTTVTGLTTVSSPDALSQDVWLVVDRNGLKCVERLDRVTTASDSIQAHTALDGATYQTIDLGAAPPTTMNVGGLAHLEGAIVRPYVGGFLSATTFVVSHGRITGVPVLSGVTPGDEGPGSVNVSVGVPFISEFQLLRPDVGSANGTSIGKTRRVNKYAILLYNAAGLSMGTDFDHLNAALPVAGILGNPGPVAANVEVVTFTGIAYAALDDKYSKDGMLCGRVQGPSACTILSLTGLIDTQDGT